MAISILQGFQTLKTNLELTDLQAETVSTRQQSVRKVVENGFTVVESFLADSYKRNTMIAPLPEADTCLGDPGSETNPYRLKADVTR